MRSARNRRASRTGLARWYPNVRDNIRVPGRESKPVEAQPVHRGGNSRRLARALGSRHRRRTGRVPAGEVPLGTARRDARTAGCLAALVPDLGKGGPAADDLRFGTGRRRRIVGPAGWRLAVPARRPRPGRGHLAMQAGTPRFQQTESRTAASRHGRPACYAWRIWW
jgi:hypothetical protein